jgi:hypothetical protein
LNSRSSKHILNLLILERKVPFRRKKNYHEKMKINVKTLDGRSVVFEVESSDTVQSLKEQIQFGLGFDTDAQRLIHVGRGLSSEKTLFDYNIGENDTVYLVLRLGTPQSPTHTESSQTKQSNAERARSVEPTSVNETVEEIEMLKNKVVNRLRKD